jgi:DNA-binding MarR family transcriptional regulator
MSKPGGNADPSALAEIDRLVHEPARMAIMSLLYVVESADFIFLMNQTGLTWGNLSAHLAKLEAAGYLEVEKAFKGKRPNTTLRLTDRGRQAFRQYALQMKQAFGDFEG